jgi:hypothetical protein
MILSTIQAVVAGLPKPVAFVYANLFDANGELDIPALMEGKDRAFIYVPPLENEDDPDEQGLLHTTFPLEFYFLRKRPVDQEGTIDYTSEEVQPIIDEMRALGRLFVHRLEEQDIVEKGTERANGIGKRKYTSLYGWLDIHVFGIFGECQVPIMDGSTGCEFPAEFANA